MVIKLPAMQITEHWDTIKFCVLEVNPIEPEDQKRYLNELLQALLGSTAQCWVRLDEKQERIVSLGITRIEMDKQTGRKILFFQCLYSFEKIPFEVWESDWSFMGDFATKNRCSKVVFDSDNPRIYELAEAVGFKEKSRRFELKTGV